MKKIIFSIVCLIGIITEIQAQAVKIQSKLAIMTPGNNAVEYTLSDGGNGILSADKALPVEVRRSLAETDGGTEVTISITAKSGVVYYNISQTCLLAGMRHADCEFYMPGFWYHKNLRSPKEAPSFHTSDSWEVREDRLSSPLTGVFNPADGSYATVRRTVDAPAECVRENLSGDVILTGKTSVGSTGFRNVGGTPALVFSFPYIEAPKRYIRKLTLIPAVRTFEKLEKGETRTIKWTIHNGKAQDFSQFVENVWNYTYDTFKPQPVNTGFTVEYAKNTLSNFFKESYNGAYNLKFYSGEAIHTDRCEKVGAYQIGFVGRSLLNAFNALEYGETNGRTDLVADANSVFDSHLTYGFSPSGFFLECGDVAKGHYNKVLSIRRQSEGVFALLFYLQYEKENGRKHPEMEAKIKTVLANLMSLIQPDGSFPRKFDAEKHIIDGTGGSTPSVTVPLAMAYKYFKDKQYLECAKKTIAYLEKEIIDKADYFSSTLDANCEDKEAALAATTALYYMAHVTKGAERTHYLQQCKKAAYFCLSWYYLWDVPFAQGQMLGDVNFKSRGWGNVSVENNHIDVFIFEFTSILDWLTAETGEARFAEFAKVITSSMLQLMPDEGHYFNIAKKGFYPEVVQHTSWDYGHNGKGFYNDIFAPGWTVPSLWQMLTPDRVAVYFGEKKRK